MTTDQSLRILVPLSECKTILGLDDRDDSFTRFLLITASVTVENYLSRRLLHRAHTHYTDYLGQTTIPLKEYPVQRIDAVYADRTRQFTEATRLQPEHYYLTPDPSTFEDLPANLCIPIPNQLPRAPQSLKILYTAGYLLTEIPPDLQQAIIELVAWNFTRYQSHRIGVTGALRGTGKVTESLERTIPEHIRIVLEPYRRRTI